MARERVSSILRALQILECFTDNETEWTLKALEQSAKRYSVSGAGKPTLTIRRSNQVKSLWNRGNQLILDANTPFTQDGFHLCPHLLNGIQIRAIWRQIERYCTFCSNQFAHKIAMMRSEIVHNDIVTLMNRRQKDGFQVFFEAFFCRASFKRHTGKLTILTDCRQDRCTFGGAERSMIHHSGLSHRTAIPSYQVRVYTAFIQKNQLFSWYFFREFFPFRPLFLYIGAAPVPKRESPSSSASTPISRARSDPVGIH